MADKMLKVSQDFTVAPYYITCIVYILEPTIFYGWNEQIIWKSEFSVSLNVVHWVNSIQLRPVVREVASLLSPETQTISRREAEGNSLCFGGQ